ncbi:MAG: hypothetical protein NT120_02365 [Candidatus Aenigmarchaeota archaeon]|nr:hypothetical protein [Candidatus Aenigmarchaeota archaeon]
MELEVKSADCSRGTAEVYISAEDMPDWKTVEIVKVGFFRQSECTANLEEKRLGDMESLCTKDFLGTILYEAPLVGSC